MSFNGQRWDEFGESKTNHKYIICNATDVLNLFWYADELKYRENKYKYERFDHYGGHRWF